jgi:hypothetical protein
MNIYYRQQYAELVVWKGLLVLSDRREIMPILLTAVAPGCIV